MAKTDARTLSLGAQEQLRKQPIRLKKKGVMARFYFTLILPHSYRDTGWKPIKRDAATKRCLHSDLQQKA
ncbi:MAG: hypothetical protein ACC618_04600 [Patescibacteria group bacterium]